MPLKFFYDENITKRIVQIIAAEGFHVDRVRNQKQLGISNGELTNYVNTHDYTLVTFDKDFLESNLRIQGWVVVIEVHPNRDEYVKPILTKFLMLVKENKIECYGKVILLNKQFLDAKREKW